MKETFLRFPFSILFAIVVTVSMVMGVNKNNRENEEFFFKIALFGILGFTTLIGPVLFSESKRLKKSINLILQVVMIGLIAFYYCISPNPDDFKAIDINIFFLLFIVSIIAVTYWPFLTRGNQEGFWRYNNRIFSRLFTTILYGAFLFGGIALAMVAIHFLFNVDIRDERYTQLFFIVTGFFGSFFFLGGMPDSYDKPDEEYSYPKGLKFFTQYILLPLIALYFIILYSYSARILFLWELPKGWVSYLVLALAGVAILAFLFVWPVNNKGNNWVKTYSKYVYILLLPLLVLLFAAISRRITDYGITVNRYYVFVAACWLTGICFYYLFSKAKNIKVIPISFTIVALFILFGPWSVFSVSQKSQINRLEKILSQNEVLINGKINGNHPIIQDSIEVEINTILKFLDETNALPSLEKRWNTQLVDTATSLTLDRYSVAEVLKLVSTNTYYYPKESTHLDDFNFYTSTNVVVNVDGYSYYIPDQTINSYEYSTDSIRFQIKDNEYIIRKSLQNDSLNIFINESLVYYKSIRDIYSRFKTIKSKEDTRTEEINNPIKICDDEKVAFFEFELPEAKFKCYINNLDGFIKKDSTVYFDRVSLSILIRDKQK